MSHDVPIGANPNFLSTWASAHLLLGEVGVARPAVDQLVAMGYYTPDFAAVLAASLKIATHYHPMTLLAERVETISAGGVR